jgi:hypothetical protein
MCWVVRDCAPLLGHKTQRRAEFHARARRLLMRHKGQKDALLSMLDRHRRAA